MTWRRSRRTSLSVIVALAMVAGTLVGLHATPSSASPLPAPAADGAADYLPTASDVPGGFREQATSDVGGLLEPGSALRRTFVSADGDRTLTVEVHVGQSAADGQHMLDDRVNQLVQYQGGIARIEPTLGERAFTVTTAPAEGQAGLAYLFRVNAIYAEAALVAPTADSTLLATVARFVEARMYEAADAVTYVPGLPAPTPQQLPGKEPPGAPAGGGGSGGGVGNTSGSPGTNDTVVQFTLTAMDRPWLGMVGPRPPQGFNYLTVQVMIETFGPTPANILPEDFTAVSLDNREWPPVVAREPALQATQVVTGLPVTGWLTFAIPTDQPATQLVWRLRSMQTLTSQGGADQILTIPLTVGASANASIGSPAPPAGMPVQPPSAVPPGSAPFSPVAPGAQPVPSAPSTSPGGGSGGGGGSNRGPRLQ